MTLLNSSLDDHPQLVSRLGQQHHGDTLNLQSAPSLDPATKAADASGCSCLMTLTEAGNQYADRDSEPDLSRAASAVSVGVTGR